MKIKKPEDEKYFKDVVLHDILEEISHETGASFIKKPKNRTPLKRSLFTKMFFWLVSLLLILFIMLLFHFVSDATRDKHPIIQKTISDPQAWKMKEDRDTDRHHLTKKIRPKQVVVHPQIKRETIEINTIKEPISRKKTERELAKEALRQQMLR